MPKNQGPGPLRQERREIRLWAGQLFLIFQASNLVKKALGGVGRLGGVTETVEHETRPVLQHVGAGIGARDLDRVVSYTEDAGGDCSDCNLRY